MSTNNSNLNLGNLNPDTHFTVTGAVAPNFDFSLVETSQKGAVYRAKDPANSRATYRVVIGRTATKENGSKWPTTRTAIRLERTEISASSDTPVTLMSHMTLVVSEPDVIPTGMTAHADRRPQMAQALLAMLSQCEIAESGAVLSVNADNWSPLFQVLDGSN